MIKIGIIGLGHMGGYHASVCSQLNSISLVGVADPNNQTWNKVKKDGVIKSHDYMSWINIVDAVIIALPTEFHYTVAKDCLQRGKHVLLEKPLTKTLDEAVELFNIAQKNNVALHVGHVERFNGAVQELKKIIDNPFLIESHRMG
ncbi:MAG: Gfo/Idh/MocA family oxidoreductase, partial [bacterium]